MTKQELIEQGFKYIATQNCEQKTEVWARFMGWEYAIDFISERSNIEKDTIKKVLELEEEYMKSIGVIVDKEERTNPLWTIDGMQRIEESINIDNPSQRNYTQWIVDDLQKITKAREDFINGEFNCSLKGDKK